MLQKRQNKSYKLQYVFLYVRCTENDQHYFKFGVGPELMGQVNVGAFYFMRINKTIRTRVEEQNLSNATNHVGSEANKAILSFTRHLGRL